MATSNFSIDRRPVAMIANYGGLFDQTTSGQPSWLYEPGGVAELIDRKILPLYEMGFRRMILHLPAGTPLRDRLMTSCQWGYLPDYRKEEFKTVMKSFLHRYPDIDLGVYMGFEIYADDPTNPIMPETGDDAVVPPDFEIRSHRDWFAYNVGNYVDIGINWFMADAATAEREAARKVHNALIAAGIRYGGEALPTSRIDGEGWFIDDEIFNLPWLCMNRFAAIRDPDFRWDFDPDLTEVMCIMSGHGADDGHIVTEEVIRKRAEQGFIIGTMFNADDERTRWAYDIGMEYYEKWKNPPVDIPEVVKELRYETLEELAMDQR